MLATSATRAFKGKGEEIRKFSARELQAPLGLFEDGLLFEDCGDFGARLTIARIKK